MRRTYPLAILLSLGLAAAGLLGACGSGAKTTTSASAPATAGTTTSNPGSSSTTSAPNPSTQTSTSTGTGTTGTRSAPEPAFTQQGSKGGGLSAASAAVRSMGFTPVHTSDFHADQTLQVLVGTRTGSVSGYGQKAFFFVDGRFIGTDATQASATVGVFTQSDTEVTLSYPLYRRTDNFTSPSGGMAHVRFQLNNGKLVALDPLPPVGSDSGLSRQ